jgi:hypothetical protein
MDYLLLDRVTAVSSSHCPPTGTGSMNVFYKLYEQLFRYYEQANINDTRHDARNYGTKPTPGLEKRSYFAKPILPNSDFTHFYQIVPGYNRLAPANSPHRIYNSAKPGFPNPFFKTAYF